MASLNKNEGLKSKLKKQIPSYLNKLIKLHDFPVTLKTDYNGYFVVGMWVNITLNVTLKDKDNIDREVPIQIRFKDGDYEDLASKLFDPKYFNKLDQAAKINAFGVEDKITLALIRILRATFNVIVDVLGHQDKVLALWKMHQKERAFKIYFMVREDGDIWFDYRY